MRLTDQKSGQWEVPVDAANVGGDGLQILGLDDQPALQVAGPQLHGAVHGCRAQPVAAVGDAVDGGTVRLQHGTGRDEGKK